MLLSDIKPMLDQLEIPNAYYEFPDKSGIAPPFVCWYFPTTEGLKADNVNYQNINDLVIELYTAEKDFILEAALEAILTAHSLPYNRAENYIDGQKMWMITYTTEVLINA